MERASRGFTRGSLLISSVAGLLLLGLFGCSSGRSHVSTAESVDWPRFGNSSDNTRFSPLNQINAATVHKLGIAWSLSEGPNLSLFESDPVVVEGTMYLTTNTDQVLALDAATGKIRWQYTPILSLFQSTLPDAAAPTSRGATVADGAIYLLTFDDQLIALRASNGKRIWRTVVADPMAGYSEPSPPTFWDGMLFVGSAEGDSGARGFVAAYSATTGRQIWRFYTVPAPGNGWVPKHGHHGGGDVWMPPTIDTRTGVLYVGTGNPSPNLSNETRPGCNRWTDATVALDARTGRFLWGRTHICPDLWDYDTAQPPMLIDVRRGESTVRAVGQGSKDGHYSMFAAANGRPLFRSPSVIPETVPRPAPSSKGVKVCPGEFGGILYSPAAYNPHLRAIYIPALQMCGVYRSAPKREIHSHRRGAADVGGVIRPVGPFSGTMTAIDAGSGRFLWHRTLPAPLVGGALATGGNLVFSGCDDGRFYAFDARTGATRWVKSIGLPFGAAPITYMVRGVQYVAVAAGGSAVAALENVRVGGRLFVFRIGGRSTHHISR